MVDLTYDPAHPTPTTPNTRHPSPIHAPPPPPPRDWQDDVDFLRTASRPAAARRFERMMTMETSEERIIERIIFVLTSVSPTLSRYYGPIAFSRAPFNVRYPLAIRIITKRVIHSSFLHTLSLLAYGELPAAVIMDQLLDNKTDDHSLDNYLTLTTPNTADEFVDFATPLLLEDIDSIRSKLAHYDFFPIDYLEEEQKQNRFTPQRIASLINKVCRAKDLAIPRHAKIVLLHDFCAFLVEQFRQQHIYTGDLLLMIREAIDRFQLGFEVPAEFFCDHIADFARHLCQLGNFPAPNIPPNSANLPFVDIPCSSDHSKILPALKDIGEIIIHNDCTLFCLKKELDVSSCITILHHEPPRLMPFAERIDMISIRMLHNVFHVFTDPTY